MEEATTSKKVPAWQFWKKQADGVSGASSFVTPADWLNTDLKTGLDPMEVERRRKYTGWNELTTEKENMLLKFIGFFRGPILYGKPHFFSPALPPILGGKTEKTLWPSRPGSLFRTGHCRMKHQ